MRNFRFVGVAYAKSIADWGGKEKSPCICAGFAKHYSQLQYYPMIMEVYEKGCDSD